MKRIAPILCLLLSLIIVIVSMSTVSFSWFEPDIKEGIGLEFKEEAKLRAQTCSLVTYQGTMGNKVVNYSGSSIGTSSVTLNEGDIAYYKTIISNSSREYDTVVSLFLPSFTPSAGSSKICVMYPTNSVRSYVEAQTDLHIIRNAYVPMLVETDANPGQLVVEWFVKCDTGSVTFNLGDLYLMYS